MYYIFLGSASSIFVEKSEHLGFVPRKELIFCVIAAGMILMYVGFINGSEFTDQYSPAPTAVPPPSSSASSTPPTAKADLPSVKKRPKRSKGGAKGDGSADGGIFD